MESIRMNTPGTGETVHYVQTRLDLGCWTVGIGSK